MIVKTFGERTGGVLNRGMHMEPLSKGMHICEQKENARKSVQEINTEILRLQEAGETLQSRHDSLARRD